MAPEEALTVLGLLALAIGAIAGWYVFQRGAKQAEQELAARREKILSRLHYHATPWPAETRNAGIQHESKPKPAIKRRNTPAGNAEAAKAKRKPRARKPAGKEA